MCSSSAESDQRLAGKTVIQGFFATGHRPRHTEPCGLLHRSSYSMVQARVNSYYRTHQVEELTDFFLLLLSPLHSQLSSPCYQAQTLCYRYYLYDQRYLPCKKRVMLHHRHRVCHLVITDQMSARFQQLVHPEKIVIAHRCPVRQIFAGDGSHPTNPIENHHVSISLF